VGDALYLGWCTYCKELVLCAAPDTERGVCDFCGCDSVFGPAVVEEAPEINPNLMAGLGEDTDV
jgi:hypothetical protein